MKKLEKFTNDFQDLCMSERTWTLQLKVNNIIDKVIYSSDIIDGLIMESQCLYGKINILDKRLSDLEQCSINDFRQCQPFEQIGYKEGDILCANKGTFEWALIQMKMGKKLVRKNWNGKGQYVFISRQDGPGDPLEDHFRICTSQQKVNTWVPSVSDLFSDDWNL